MVNDPRSGDEWKAEKPEVTLPRNAEGYVIEPSGAELAARASRRDANRVMMRRTWETILASLKGARG